MADVKDLLAMGAMVLALFIVGILVGVSIIGFGELKKSACEQNINDAYVWEGGACLNESAATGGTAVTVTAVTKIAVVETTVDVILGLLALVVIMGVFLIVVKAARKMKSGFGGQ